jgi:hypothetical protein
MTLRHISPRSIDWMDAMDEGAGGRGWEKLAPEERIKLREGEYASEYASAWAQERQDGQERQESKQEPTEAPKDDDYGWEAVSASR